ncbi:hypothetical protein ACFXHA_44695 [Nocardia sp. NPDC059240]|uniref:hypothetical protein n=1 Tax=Nocardia sp. NPDC059240 TaxID=3346786 RepID=UPI0036B4716F
MHLANSWNSYETLEYQYWAVEFPVWPTAAALLVWQDVVLTAGERYEVLRVDEVEAFGYSRLRDGSFAEFIRAHPQRTEPVNDGIPVGFALDRIDGEYAGIHTSTLLCFAGADGRLTKDWMNRMTDVGPRAGLSEYYDNTPFSITADSEAYPGSTHSAWAQFTVTTDIFFPWVQPGVDHPLRRYGLLDNTFLARLNGSRLNGFLREVRRAAVEIGGVWKPATTAYDRTASLNLDEDGFVLVGEA